MFAMEVFAYAVNEVIRDSRWKSSFHASLAHVKTPIPFEDSISSRLMVDQFAAISIFVFHAMFDRLRHIDTNYARIIAVLNEDHLFDILCLLNSPEQAR